MRVDRKSRYGKGMILLLGGSLLLAGCGKDAEQPAEASAVVVEMEQAQTGDLVLHNSFVGTVSPQEQVYVIPLASGVVTETYFEAGDYVNAGDVLFQIDDSSARLQLEQAQLSLTSTRQQVDSALGTQQESTDIQLESSKIQTQSSYEQAQIQYFNLKNNYDKLDDTVDELEEAIEKLEGQIKAASTVSGSDASVAALRSQLAALQSNLATARSAKEQMKPQYQAAASAYRAAEAALGITDKSAELTTGQVLEDTRAQLDTSLDMARLGVKSAELALSYYTVEAPISGTVQSKNIEVNGVAASSNPAYVISNENTMVVTFQVSEAVRNTLSAGQEITVERGGSSYSGNITQIGVSVNQQTGLFQIKAAVNADGNTLPSGVSVKLHTDTYRAEDAILIPYDAVYYDNDGSYVYLCVDNTAVKSYVETGIFDDSTITVTSGISAGDTVITSWSPRLVNGAEVTEAVRAQDGIQDSTQAE